LENRIHWLGMVVVGLRVRGVAFVLRGAQVLRRRRLKSFEGGVGAETMGRGEGRRLRKGEGVR